jgi:hypothetical protein
MAVQTQEASHAIFRLPLIALGAWVALLILGRLQQHLHQDNVLTAFPAPVLGGSRESIAAHQTEHIDVFRLGWWHALHMLASSTKV